MQRSDVKKGIVFDINGFSVHDGPGLRQTVFMKGCPMKCSWCHNPEGQSIKPQLMIKTASCIHCGKCMSVCKHPFECVVCGKCIKACTERLRSISGVEYSCFELEEKLRKNIGFYRKCGGGVTFSGGEPLMQWEFISEMLDRLSDVHVALETAAYVDSEAFKNVILKTDLVLMDFKIYNSELHKIYTGVANEQIKENLEVLKKSGVPFIIRIPVIPGVNDNLENFENTAMLLENCKTLIRVEMLPYHKTAGAKYKMLSMKYEPKFDVNQEIVLMPEVFEKRGIECYVM